MKKLRNARLWRTSATLGALAAFAAVLGASERGDASPATIPILALPMNPPSPCDNDASWFTTGRAPTCAAGDPKVKVTTSTTTVANCPQTKCTQYTPMTTTTYVPGTHYACKSAAIAANCPSQVVVGTVTPLYYIAAIIYSPPGCTNSASAKCGQISNVDYQTGSSNGAQTSTQSSFQAGIKVEATASVGNEITGSLSATASVGFQQTSTNGSSMTITKKQSSDLKISGNQDGINHDQDQFVLVVNPLLTYSATDDDIKWAIGASASTFQYVVSVKDLKDPTTNAARMKTLTDLGFTSTDFQTILAQNPFSSGSTAIDQTRFVPTTWRNIPYETPDTSTDCNGGTCSCLSISQSISNELATSATSSTQQQYTVGLSVTAQSPKAWPVNVKATVSGSLAWTNTASTNNTTSNSQSATVTIQCPSPGYTGSQVMDVYWDTLYGAFLFAPHAFGSKAKMMAHTGHVTTSTGAAAKRVRVDLTYGGKTFHTFTNKNGDYTFEGVPPGQGQLSIRGQTTNVTFGGPAKTNVKLPQ